jgi:hypothetical protein
MSLLSAQDQARKFDSSKTAKSAACMLPPKKRNHTGLQQREPQLRRPGEST